MAAPVLGILTLYLNDRKFIEDKHVYAKMTAIGKRIGMAVYVFTPEDVDDRRHRIYAHVYDPEKKRWARKWVRFPNLIYDRCRIQKSKRFEKLLAFRRQYGHLTFLNRPLRNKWTVYRTLGKFPAFRMHLPMTRAYRSPQDVLLLLKRFPLLFLKPVNGTGGRGVLRIVRLANGDFMLQGRNRSRRIVPARRVRRQMLPAALRRWTAQGDRYIVQQGIRTELDGGRVHDYRPVAGHGLRRPDRPGGQRHLQPARRRAGRPDEHPAQALDRPRGKNRAGARNGGMAGHRRRPHTGSFVRRPVRTGPRSGH